MKKRIIERELAIAITRKEIFEFFLEPENLARITPGNLNFNIVSAHPLPIQEGTIITYRLKLFGIPFKWISKIIDFESPAEFKDIQIGGPYKFWCHTHTFKEEGESTRIIDRVEYAVPGGILEPLIHKFLVKPQLKKIFDYRTQKIRQIFAQSGEI